MLLNLTHKRLTVYNTALEIIDECYRLCSLLPNSELYNLSSQIKRAALSIALNIAEGSSRITRSERKRFFEISRASLVEVDTALTIAIRLNYFEETALEYIGKKLSDCFNMLSKMIKTLSEKPTK